MKHPESIRFCGFQNVTINLPQAAYRAKGKEDEGTFDLVFNDEAEDLKNLKQVELPD